MAKTGKEATGSREIANLADDVLTTSRALVAIAVRTITSAGVEVTVVQHRVLVLLAAHGNLTVTAIADALGVNQSNASRICSRLERLELVDRRRSAEDGRAVDVSLTVSGKRLVRSVTIARQREIAAVLARLSTDEARGVASAFHAFNEAAHEVPDHDWLNTPW